MDQLMDEDWGDGRGQLIGVYAIQLPPEYTKSIEAFWNQELVVFLDQWFPKNLRFFPPKPLKRPKFRSVP